MKKPITKSKRAAARLIDMDAGIDREHTAAAALFREAIEAPLRDIRHWVFIAQNNPDHIQHIDYPDGLFLELTVTKWVTVVILSKPGGFPCEELAYFMLFWPYPVEPKCLMKAAPGDPHSPHIECHSVIASWFTKKIWW